MSKFINKEDYLASVHGDILNSVTRDDDAIIEICEDRAIEEMKSYLNHRYDISQIFSAEGSERNQLILMFAIDMAIYHIFCIHNPQKISDVREERYKRAVEWLKQVANEKISIVDAPLLDKEIRQERSQFLIASNPKKQFNF